MLIRLRGCACWSAPLLFAYGIRHVFAWPGPYDIVDLLVDNHAMSVSLTSVCHFRRWSRVLHETLESHLHHNVTYFNHKGAASWQHQQNYLCATSEDSDQPGLGIRPVWSVSSLSAWRKLWSLATHWTQTKTLIRLGIRPGWSESSLGTHVILLVLSWGGPNVFLKYGSQSGNQTNNIF